MSQSTPQETTRFTFDYSYRQERDYEGSINKRIEHEELKFKEAIKTDKPFYVVKAIRVKINDLKRLKEMIKAPKYLSGRLY